MNCIKINEWKSGHIEYQLDLYDQPDRIGISRDIRDTCVARNQRMGIWYFPPCEVEGLSAVAQKWNILFEQPAYYRAMSDLENIAELRRVKNGDFPKINLVNFLITPRDFQFIGIAFLRSIHRGFLCDTMGLGKTVQALAMIDYCGLYPALVVCPASAIYVWVDHIKACITRPITVSLLRSNGDAPTNSGHGVNIVSYDTLGKLKDRLVSCAPDIRAIMLDESQWLKNKDTKRAQSARKTVAAYPKAKAICLTGTPVPNRPRELLAQLSILGIDQYFGGRSGFLTQFCFNEATGTYSGGKNLLRLNRMLEPFLLRRRKREVLPELPGNQRATVQMSGTPSVMEEYRKAEINFVNYLKDEAASLASSQGSSVEAVLDSTKWKAMEGIHIMKTTRLKKLNGIAKVDESVSFLEQFVASSDEQIVVFAHHKEVINPTSISMNWPVIVGSTPPRQRKELADRFMGGEWRGIIVSMLCAVSLSLHSATATMTIELPWVPAQDMQSTDRIRRIGQTKATTSYYGIIPETIDNRVIELLLEKTGLISQVVDGIELSDEQIYGSIFGKLTKELVLGR